MVLIINESGINLDTQCSLDTCQIQYNSIKLSKNC